MTGQVSAKKIGQSQQRQVVRALLGAIKNDLSMAFAPLETSTTGAQLLLNPSSISKELLAPSALFWQAPVAGDTRFGDLSPVGYFVRWDTTDTANPRPRLCRLQVDPVAPKTSNPTYRIYSHPGDWVNDGVLEAAAPANRAHDYAGLFAEDVVGFWVRCLDASGGVLAESNATYDSRSGGFPAAVTVSFAVIDSRLARQITPAIKEELERLTTQSSDAFAFVKAAQANTSLSAIREGIHAAATTVYLRGAR
jgi:hypothetical protein